MVVDIKTVVERLNSLTNKIKTVVERLNSLTNKIKTVVDGFRIIKMVKEYLKS